MPTAPVTISSTNSTRSRSTPAPRDSTCQTIATTVTAGSATIGGRVVSPYGRGLSGATVTMFDVFGGRRTARTNSFGYYSFADVPAGRTYYFQVNSKKYVFEEPIRVLSVEDDFGGLDFYASPLDDYSTGSK